ncbi:MAG TPA: acyltransferase family protein [Mucilaginibacter sp.]|nr:acyltransferase family protein [Mucilaginibacter sp.]
MSATPSVIVPAQKKKICYIDNLKVLLTVLVILHHTFITYGAPGGWYYTQKTTRAGALIPMTMFVAINQAFFMGFFFFLSAYFTGPSYDRKGAARFTADRLLRLGLPLVFYSFIFSPFLSYLVYYYAEGHHITYWQYLSDFTGWIDFGVLWFVAALLLFTLAYIAWRVSSGKRPSPTLPVPSMGAIIAFSVFVGVISFAVRTVLPVGWVLRPLGFQPAHFSQYIAMFILGLVARRNNWLENLPVRTGRRALTAVILLFLFFPVLFVLKKAFDAPLEWFSGGLHWESLLYSIWEQMMGFCMVTMLLYYGRRYWDKSSALLSKMARSTFAVYIFHPVVIISVALALTGWAVDPALKLLVAAPLVVAGAFLLGALIRRIPGVKKII